MVRFQELNRVVEEHPIVFFDVVIVGLSSTDIFGERRFVAAFAELPDLQVLKRHHGTKGPRTV